MSARLAELEARMHGVRELGMMVNAMQGMAAARVQQARERIEAAQLHAEVVAEALRTALALAGEGDEATLPASARRRALVVFCAEQGFAGAFSERVLDAAARQPPAVELLVLGSRGVRVAAERGLEPAWSAAMPARPQGLPQLAGQIVEHLSAGLARGEFEQLDLLYSRARPGQPLDVEQRTLLPLRWPRPAQQALPLVQLPPRQLLLDFVAAHLQAQLCEAALHAFEAEAQARLQAMAAAHRHIDAELAELQLARQHMRQEDITAEIIELAAGQRAGAAEISYKPQDR